MVVRDNRLRVEAPHGVLTPPIRDQSRNDLSLGGGELFFLAGFGELVGQDIIFRSLVSIRADDGADDRAVFHPAGDAPAGWIGCR